MAASRLVSRSLLSLALLGGFVVQLAPSPSPPSEPRAPRGKHVVHKPVGGALVEEAPTEVRDFLERVLDRVPESGVGVSGYRFEHWQWKGRPTHEALGLKAVPGVGPRQLVACVMNVDGYPGNIPHVEAARSLPDAAFKPPEKVRFFEVIDVPGVARVQQELVLVDAGTVKGYRLVYWYLLKDQTRALDPQRGARSAFNIGAWLAAPGAVGYALSTWPERQDVNVVQWISLTKGENALAKVVIERTIDGMAAWARRQAEVGPTSK